MKKLRKLIVTICFIIICMIAYKIPNQLRYITNRISYPIVDYKLEDALVNVGYDANGDKRISINELEKIEGSLDLIKKDISSLEGMEYTSKIRKIYLMSNNLRDLNPLKNNKDLDTIIVPNNQLVDLKSITQFDLVSLDVSVNKSLIELDGLSNMTNLQSLSVDRIGTMKFDEIIKLKRLNSLRINYVDSEKLFHELQNFNCLINLTLYIGKDEAIRKEDLEYMNVKYNIVEMQNKYL